MTGLPGTGKTALAVEAAHRVADAFPDGLVFLDLRGADEPPPTGAEILGRLARTPLTGRRVLLVLDHVTSETQVRPLLPLAGGSAVLLTAGRVPAGLPGLRSVVLGPWRPEESRRLGGLFTGRAGIRTGAARPVAEPGTVAEIAELCGRLPLAVRAAAAQLAARPHWTPATLADRLRDEGGRLDALRTGDVDVRARLLEAYAAAPDAQRREFRLLALLPPGRFGARQAAAALGLVEARAAAALDVLADERLVAVDRDGCRLPELLRLLAVERLALEEPPEVRRAAAERVCRAYAAAAAARPGRLPDADARGLVRLARTAYEAGLWALTVRLTDATGGWVEDDAEAAFTVALDAAVRCADRSAQARMERSLGDLAWQYRRLERAQELFARALAHAREAGDEEEAGRALVGLAELRLDAGAAAEAAALLEPALAALSAPGRARYEASRARALLALAQDGPEGRSRARTWFGECLELAVGLRDHRLEVYARRSLRALSAEGASSGPWRSARGSGGSGRPVSARDRGAAPRPDPAIPFHCYVRRAMSVALGPVTELVGRERESAALVERLRDPSVRTLTVTGRAGVGKSRLAAEAVREIGGEFGRVTVVDAVRWCAAAGQEPLLTPAGPEEHGRVLLLLDGCDHDVRPAAAEAVAALAGDPRVVVLATGLEPLGVYGERLLPLAPLPVPGSAGTGDPHEVLEAASVALFVRRARDADPAFALTLENAAAVAEICTRLDGLPLAVELAARRLRLLSPQSLAARLRGRTTVLAGGPAHAPERHRSLAALAEWSCRGLAGPARALLDRLSVYEPGFGLSAAGVSAEAEVETLLDRGLLAVVGEEQGSRGWP